MAKPELKKKYDIILGRETNHARLVALKAIKPKPYSVWEVLIPIFFILSYMKSKEQREVFAQNLLFTKKLALEAAYLMLKNEDTRESAMGQIKQKTDELLATLPENVYSERIRSEQLKEIDLLIDHYCKLFGGEGSHYSDLVICAYPQRNDYADFRQKLAQAEKNVTDAARRTLGGNTDTAMATRIEETLRAVRTAEIEKIFKHQITISK
jgi:hypothetical protein